MTHTLPSPVIRPRLLLIEDNPERVAVFGRWLEWTEFVLVHAHSAGQALGLLNRDGARVIAGAMLDHDLTDAVLTEHDKTLSMSDVLPALTRALPRISPVMVHSHNLSMPLRMDRFLSSAGFTVTRRRFDQWTEPMFKAWLDDVRDAWETQLELQA